MDRDSLEDEVLLSLGLRFGSGSGCGGVCLGSLGREERGCARCVSQRATRENVKWWRTGDVRKEGRGE